MSVGRRRETYRLRYPAGKQIREEKKEEHVEMSSAGDFCSTVAISLMMQNEKDEKSGLGCLTTGYCPPGMLGLPSKTQDYLLQGKSNDTENKI